MPVEDILSGFEIVYFEQLPKDFFFGKRKDRKYIFHMQELKDILEHLTHDYNVISNQGNVISTYHTQYFDSEDHKHYHDHLHGKMNRLKYRIRTYEDGMSYFEIKTKRNTGYTLKSRVGFDGESTIVQKKGLNENADTSNLSNSGLETSVLLNEWQKIKEQGYREQLRIQYDRITLYSKDLGEKITLDIHLHFEKEEATWNSDVLVVAESKMKEHYNSVFRELMKYLHIRETSFSKYCFGMATLVPSIKRNNFKQLLRTTEKIISKYEFTSSDL